MSLPVSSQIILSYIAIGTLPVFSVTVFLYTYKYGVICPFLSLPSSHSSSVLVCLSATDLDGGFVNSRCLYH